jgi:hypothetical protein
MEFDLVARHTGLDQPQQAAERVFAAAERHEDAVIAGEVQAGRQPLDRELLDCVHVGHRSAHRHDEGGPDAAELDADPGGDFAVRPDVHAGQARAEPGTADQRGTAGAEAR